MTMQKKMMRLTVAILAMGAATAFGTGIVVSAIASEDTAKYGDSSSHGVVGDTGVSTTALSMEEILAKLNEQGFTEVYEIERERDVYEVEVLDPKIGKVELYLDPRTGRILRQETHD